MKFYLSTPVVTGSKYNQITVTVLLLTDCMTGIYFQSVFIAFLLRLLFWIGIITILLTCMPNLLHRNLTTRNRVRSKS